jgi:hypothetical protein
MLQFVEFYKSYTKNYKIIFEAFDPNVAAIKNPDHIITKVAGIDVIIPKKRGTSHGEDSTIIINQSDLMNAKSSFCDYNPAINKFSSENPNNLFFVLSLVVGTVGSSWADFRNLYPVYVAFVKETDGADIPIDYIIGLDGKKHSVKRWFYKGASGYIKKLWHNRNFLYDNIYNKGLIENEFELYKFITRYFAGASTVKSAFSVQLLSGKLGCIDNINADIYGMPITITDKSGKAIESPDFKTIQKSKSEFLTPKGEQILIDYINFVKSIGKITNSEYSQRLWDDWVQLAAAKTVFTGDKQIKFNMVDGRVAIMPTYTGATNKNPQYTEFLQNARKEGIDPYGGYEIGKEHYTLPKMGSEIDDAKSRIA